MNKAIRVGVTDFYLAKATEGQNGAITFETPKAIGGTASVGVTVNKGENKVHESDVLIHDSKRISSLTVNYKSRTVSMADEMEFVHGQTAAQSGEYEDSPDDIAPNVAVGWAARMSDGSYKCTWCYWCTGSKGNESYETADDAEKSPEDEYEFEAMPRPDTGKLRRRKICANKQAMLAFFASVEPSGNAQPSGGA